MKTKDITNFGLPMRKMVWLPEVFIFYYSNG
jgi:hypothetical protein